MRTALTRRHSLFALCAAAFSACPARAADARRYAVISLLGDQITLVYAAAVTAATSIATATVNRPTARQPGQRGPGRHRARHRTGPARRAGQLAGRAALACAPAGRAFCAGQRDQPAGWPGARCSKVGATHVVLLTKLRAPAHIQLRDSAVGVGQLQGLGYYVDRNIGIRTVETGSTGDGMLVAYAYVQLTLADAKTGQVLRRQGVRATQVHPVAARPEISDPWTCWTPRRRPNVCAACWNSNWRARSPRSSRRTAPGGLQPNAPGAASSTSLPKFSPLNSRFSVAGKAATPPRTTSSLLFMRPSFR